MIVPVKTFSAPRGGGAYGLPMQEGPPSSEIFSGWLGVSSGAYACRLQKLTSNSFVLCCQNPILHPVAPHHASEEMISSVQGVRGAGDI